MIIRHFSAAVCVCACLLSCKEDKLDVYHGDNYLHFTPTENEKAVYEYNFATEGTTAETTVTVPVELRIWGYLPETDFEYTVTISGGASGQVQGTHTFRKGHAVDTLLVTVTRAGELLSTSYSCTVKIESADAHVVAPESYTTATVSVKDDLSDAYPSWWNTTTALGDYSQVKFRLLNIYLGRFLKSLDAYTGITFKQEALNFKTWWKEKWAAGEYRYYDADGTTPLYETIPD